MESIQGPRQHMHSTSVHLHCMCLCTSLSPSHHLPSVFTAMILLFVTERRRRRTSRVSSTLWGGDLVGVHSEVLSTGHMALV